MPGLTFPVDEGMHADFACSLFNHLKRHPCPNVVQWIITEAVKIEQEFSTGKIFAIDDATYRIVVVVVDDDDSMVAPSIPPK